MLDLMGEANRIEVWLVSAALLIYYASLLILIPIVLLRYGNALAGRYTAAPCGTGLSFRVRAVGLGTFWLPIVAGWLQVELSREGIYLHLRGFLAKNHDGLLLPWQCLTSTRNLSAGHGRSRSICTLEILPSEPFSKKFKTFQLILSDEARPEIERLFSDGVSSPAIEATRGRAQWEALSWKELAMVYRCDRRLVGPQFHVPCSLVWLDDFKVTAVLAKEGLLLHRYIFFGYSLPSVLIPWKNAVSLDTGSVGPTHCGPKLELQVEGAKMLVGFPYQALEPLRELIPGLVREYEIKRDNRPHMFGGLFRH